MLLWDYYFYDYYWFCRKSDPPLSCITQDSFTVGEIEQLLEETDFKGFPVIVDNESQRLAGFVLRRDLNIAISKCTFVPACNQSFTVCRLTGWEQLGAVKSGLNFSRHD